MKSLMRVVSLVALCVLWNGAAAAQFEAEPGSQLNVSELSDGEREQITLGRAKAESPGCTIYVPAGGMDPASVIDTAMLRPLIRAMPPKTWMLFSVLSDSADASARVLESWIPRTAVGDLTAGVRAAAIARHSPRLTRFRLRIDADTTWPSISVARPVICPPVFLNGSVLGRQLSMNARELNKSFTFVWPLTTTVRGYVNEKGDVETAEVSVSSGQIRVDDLAVLAFAKRAKFKPMTVDGAPGRMWVQIRLTTSSRG